MLLLLGLLKLFACGEEVRFRILGVCCLCLCVCVCVNCERGSLSSTRRKMKYEEKVNSFDSNDFLDDPI